MAPQSPIKTSSSNPDVDYVINYSIGDTSKADAEEKLQNLLKALTRVGLEVAVRIGENNTLLVFVRPASAASFKNKIYKYRVKDWLHGVRMAQPDKDEPSAPAERLRIVRHLITDPADEGGAGITPKNGPWKNVDSIFPMHDPAFNKAWIKKWSTLTFLKREDLDEIRNMFGEKVAYYFAFTQFYFAALMLPAVFGFSAWVLLGYYSPLFAIVNVLWCISFVEYWKQQQVDLALRWGVRDVSKIQEKRNGFHFEKETKDPISGETIYHFPAKKRLMRQLLQIPFTILVVIVLGTLIATCFAIEIFLSEVYNGPFKDVLVFVPTVLLTIFVPILSSFLSGIAKKLNDFENHATTEDDNAAMISKLFIINFITSYLGIFLTAFVYVPYGSIIVPFLDFFNLTAGADAAGEKSLDPALRKFTINPDRLRKQVIYFTVTAQIVNFGLETVLPYLKQRGMKKYQQYQSERQAAKGGTSQCVSINDHADETDFLCRARHEASLEPYDVADDLREMVVQFGYLALFGVVWPLVPCSFLVNNWIELRSDAFKICQEMRRPEPLRRDGVGPWLDSLGFLAWLGSVTTAALVYMFSEGDGGPDGTPGCIKGWALLLSVFVSEHLYLLVRWCVRLVISKMDTKGMREERGQRYVLRKKYFEEHFGSDAAEDETEEGIAAKDYATEGKITRASREDDLRAESLKSSNEADRFWARQKGWHESYQVGKGLIERMESGNEGKKDQ